MPAENNSYEQIRIEQTFQCLDKAIKALTYIIIYILQTSLQFTITNSEHFLNYRRVYLNGFRK